VVPPQTMKKSYLINLGLIRLLIGLYWFNNHSTDTVDPRNALTQTDIKAVGHIVISQTNRADITLKKTGGEWQILAPLNARANPTRVNLLLSLLTIKTDRQQAATEGQDLSHFGITSDSTRLTLGQQKFIFGNVEPLRRQRYILHNNIIYLLDDTVSPLLNTSASSFIDNRLFLKDQKITSIKLPLYQETVLAEQTITLNLVNGQWQTEHDIAMDKLVELIDNWHHARALQVLPLDTITSQFKPSPFHVELTINHQHDDMTLDLHLNDASFFIINVEAELAYQFPKSLAQTLLLPIQDQ
jgi:hypothetical protein